MGDGGTLAGQALIAKLCVVRVDGNHRSGRSIGSIESQAF